MTAPVQVRAVPITADAFAPYGWVAQADGHAGRAINGGSSVRVDGVGELSLGAGGGAPCLAVFRAQARDPAGPWRELERHRLGTQTFVPMGGARCVVLVALGSDAPDAATLAAFVVGGRQAVTLRAGTWHHGLIALDDGDFVVVERGAPQVDCDVAVLAEPVAVEIAFADTGTGTGIGMGMGADTRAATPQRAVPDPLTGAGRSARPAAPGSGRCPPAPAG